MSEISIVIPSHLRAERVHTVKTALPPELCHIVVPDSQVAEYREHNPDSPIVGHPDEMLGITRKRVWIAENFGDHIQIDDDQTHFIHCEHSVEECRMDPDVAYAWIQRTAAEARMAGCFLFGMSNSPDVRNYNPLMPFSRKGFVVGGGLGWLTGSKLFMNERIVTKDDYWLAALNAHFHRTVWVDNRYTSKGAKDFVTPGGSSAIRTMDSERRDSEILIKTFGSEIFKQKARTHRSKGGSGHDAQVTFSVPL